jgi:broad specificity phosphatase PhoE
MRLLVARHGETQFNAEGRYLGSLDPPLTLRGTAQAAALSELLPQVVDEIVCSPLMRARQTAEILCARRGLRLSILEAFRERDVGAFDGLTPAEAAARYPSQWAQNVTRRWSMAPPGGESIAAVVERIHAGLGALLAQSSGETVVLVAHGFVAKVIRGLEDPGKHDFFDWQLPNGGVLEIALDVKRGPDALAAAAAELEASIRNALAARA